MATEFSFNERPWMEFMGQSYGVFEQDFYSGNDIHIGVSANTDRYHGISANNTYSFKKGSSSSWCNFWAPLDAHNRAVIFLSTSQQKNKIHLDVHLGSHANTRFNTYMSLRGGKQFNQKVAKVGLKVVHPNFYDNFKVKILDNSSISVFNKLCYEKNNFRLSQISVFQAGSSFLSNELLLGYTHREKTDLSLRLYQQHKAFKDRPKCISAIFDAVYRYSQKTLFGLETTYSTNPLEPTLLVTGLCKHQVRDLTFKMKLSSDKAVGLSMQQQSWRGLLGVGLRMELVGGQLESSFGGEMHFAL